jgi:antitoxin (DNA-binding transcriptional repressor) of toxin-antitoxin stability system
MKKMAAGSFKSKCLAVMDEVHAKCETVVITKHGKPVAKLVPWNTEKDEIYDFLGGKGAVVGDVIAPALSADEWGELK